MGDVIPLPLGQCGAVIDGPYRYRLWRTWSHGSDPLGWIMLNPSVADAALDDPTIRRCLAFTRAAGFGGIEVVNLYAYRATDPDVVQTLIASFGEAQAIGPDNDAAILDMARRCKTVVAAWGGRKFAFARGQDVRATLRHHPNIVCLGTNKDGTPHHPLYLPKNTVFMPFRSDGYVEAGPGDDDIPC